MKWHLHSGMNKKWFTCKFQFFFHQKLKKISIFFENFSVLIIYFLVFDHECAFWLHANILCTFAWSFNALVELFSAWISLCMNFTLHEFHCRRVIKFQKWLINSKNQNCPHSSASPCGHAICNIKCSKKLVVNSRFSRRYNDSSTMSHRQKLKFWYDEKSEKILIFWILFFSQKSHNIILLCLLLIWSHFLIPLSTCVLASVGDTLLRPLKIKIDTPKLAPSKIKK